MFVDLGPLASRVVALHNECVVKKPRSIFQTTGGLARYRLRLHTSTPVLSFKRSVHSAFPACPPPQDGMVPLDRMSEAAYVAIAYQQFKISDASEAQNAEMQEVDLIASRFRQELIRVSDTIDEIHQWRAKSDDIQATFFPWLAENYATVFESQRGFERTTTPFNRPDAQLSLDHSRPNRIIVEVERGGTVTNGHDLKDLWKAHLSLTAKHLFLVVPNSITDESGKQRADNAVNRCILRLGSFFGDPRTQVDIWSLHLFGYGPQHGYIE